MRKIGATKPFDDDVVPERTPKCKTAVYRLSRTYERPMECAAHCPERYPAVADSVSCLVPVKMIEFITKYDFYIIYYLNLPARVR